MNKIKVTLDPEQREKYINRLLELDGLSHIKEDQKAAYCPISLTNTPDEIKPVLKFRQSVLMEKLAASGITAYDPSTAPYSPDLNLTAQPNEVYVVDSGKIVGARFFVGHNILPSTGQGIEAEKAKIYNRIVVILVDKKIRVSRMQPHRAIYLHYDNFEKEAKHLIPVFEMLQRYDPGIGFNGSLPVLLGFEKKTGKVVDLEQEIYEEFPFLQYTYEGKAHIVKLKVENSEIFYDFKKKKNKR